MGYLFYSTIFALLVFSTSLVLTRSHWLPYLFSMPGSQTASHLYSRLPSFTNASPSSFTTDVEAGLHSSTFNLAENIEAGDDRAGLDDKSKREILKIMRKNRNSNGGRGMGFDEARRVYMQECFRKEGIGEDGRPRDPKFVSFS